MQKRVFIGGFELSYNKQSCRACGKTYNKIKKFDLRLGLRKIFEEFSKKFSGFLEA